MSLESNLSGFDISDIAENETGYNYYGFTRADDSWKILRESIAGTEFRLAVGKTGYAAAFTGRASLTYKRPDQLPRV
jgi:hypothetical protein